MPEVASSAVAASSAVVASVGAACADVASSGAGGGPEDVCIAVVGPGLGL